MNFSRFLASLTRTTKTPWWVKIHTQTPDCIYYFGPFDTGKEAKRSQSGYVEDLMNEKAQGITVELTQTHPQELTIYRDISS